MHLYYWGAVRVWKGSTDVTGLLLSFLPPPPPPPPSPTKETKNCISIVFSFSLRSCNTKEKWKKGYAKLGEGWGRGRRGQIKSLMGSVEDHLSVFKSTCSWELDFSSLTENCRTTDAAIFVRLWWLKRSQKSAKRQVYLKVLLLPRTEYSWFT